MILFSIGSHNKHIITRGCLLQQHGGASLPKHNTMGSCCFCQWHVLHEKKILVSFQSSRFKVILLKFRASTDLGEIVKGIVLNHLKAPYFETGENWNIHESFTTNTKAFSDWHACRNSKSGVYSMMLFFCFQLAKPHRFGFITPPCSTPLRWPLSVDQVLFAASACPENNCLKTLRD